MNTPTSTFEYPESPEQFQARVLNSVMQHSERHYYQPADKMPYHNAEHINFVHEKVIEYCDYASANGQPVDMFSLRLAAILHDANYHEDINLASSRLMSRRLISEPFESKEAYSAWTADLLLQSYGIDQPTRNKVTSCILATNFQIDPVTIEEKILVRADLDNIAGPKATFLENTLKIVREAELMNGPKNPLERIAMSYKILHEYLDKDLCFGDFDRDVYYKNFKKPALANIGRVTEQNIKTTIRLLGERALSLLPSLGKSD